MNTFIIGAVRTDKLHSIAAAADISYSANLQAQMIDLFQFTAAEGHFNNRD